MKQITAQRVAIGQHIPPLKKLYLYSSDEYEIFTSEWIEIKKQNYFDIERLGGAGDMGRDIIAYLEDPQKNTKNYKWDCYQCKHYDKPLTPTDVWVEFGKIIYYSFIEEYPVPENYYFVSPKGIGTTLTKYLNNPSILKKELNKNWNNYCESKITKKSDVMLTGELLDYFNNFTFSIFKKIKPSKIIEEYKVHPNYYIRFGGVLPERDVITDIPDHPRSNELRYINQLIKAYNSDSIKELSGTSMLSGNYLNHFNRARKSFYFAEELRNFTRDNLPEQVFKNFQENIYDGVINSVEEDYINAYKKVKKVEDVATKIPIDSNPLREVCNPIDKKGICHQLVNENQISWVDEDE